MKDKQIFVQIQKALDRKDAHKAENLLVSAKKHFGGGGEMPPYYFYQRGLLEQLKGSDKKNVVLPLFVQAYNNGLTEETDFLKHYGSLLLELGMSVPACEIFGKLLRINNDDAETLVNLAVAFEGTGNPVSAVNTYKMALKLKSAKPIMPVICSNAAGALMKIGLQDESIEMYAKALELDSKNSAFVSSFLFNSNYVDMSREEHYETSRKYRTLRETETVPLRPLIPQTERIKVGFISRDFCSHAVSLFMSAIFETYDKTKFEYQIFSTLPQEKYDAVTKIFMNLADRWHNISNIDYRSAAKIIRDEKITALIDLSGHSGGNGLSIFGLRPAPVQISYCGYPNTTGLDSIGYRITDEICEPKDAQNFHSEKLWKLDGCFLCYQLSSTINPPECSFEKLGGRPIVFGSFNNLSKITPVTIKLWTEVLKSTPNSKLALKYKQLSDPKLKELIISRFVMNGISPDRIIVMEFNADINEHYGQYNKIDIALDTFPYNGTTTTCDALYMGVPVITLLGDRHCSRVSASLLTAVGLPELVAKDSGSFIRVASELAKDTDRLSKMKQTLREKMRNSPLYDKKTFAAKWQNAILSIIKEVGQENS